MGEHPAQAAIRDENESRRRYDIATYKEVAETVERLRRIHGVHNPGDRGDTFAKKKVYEALREAEVWANSIWKS